MKRKYALMINKKDVVEMTKRIAVKMMLKETVKKNQKDAMMGGWYPQRKVEKSQAQWKN